MQDFQQFLISLLSSLLVSIIIKCLAIFCSSWEDRFLLDLVGYPEDRFSCDMLIYDRNLNGNVCDRKMSANKEVISTAELTK